MPSKNSMKKFLNIYIVEVNIYDLTNDNTELQKMLEHVYCFKYHYQASMCLLKDLIDCSFSLDAQISYTLFFF